MPRMRTTWDLCGFGAAVTCAAVAVAEPPPRFVATPPPALTVGSHASLVVQLAPASLNERPWMVTANAEGAAVEVVRGRVLRGDAEPSSKQDGVWLEIPLLARAEGRTVVHLRFDGYRCDPDCQPLTLETVAVLESRR